MATGLKATIHTFTKHIPYNPNYLVTVRPRKDGTTSGQQNAPVKPVELTAESLSDTSIRLLTISRQGGRDG